MPKANRKTTPTKKTDAGKTRVIVKRRRRSGTLSVRRMKMQMGSTGRNIPTATLLRVIQSSIITAAEELNMRDGVRLSRQAAAKIHELVEAFVTGAMSEAVKLMVSSGRKQLIGKDLDDYLNTLPPTHPLVDDPYETSHERIGPSAITMTSVEKQRLTTKKKTATTAAESDDDDTDGGEGEDVVDA